MIGIISWGSQVLVTAAKGVAGGGDSSDGLNHAKAKSIIAQDPEPLVVLSTGSELRGVGSRGETRSQPPGSGDGALNVQLHRFCC